MYTGPKLTNDNLVFGYDTGYPISDNDTATRFSPGKPAVNLVPDADTMAGWSAYSAGNDGTFVTEFGTTGYKIINTASWNGLYKDITLPSTGVYTFSAWFRLHQSSTGNNGATVYISGWGGSDTNTAIDRSKIGEWQRIEKTITVTDVTLRYYLISFGGSNATSSWEVTMPQVELASERTPFVSGTRSDTASLIDLKKTANIDVSGISFDSNAQPVWDGTDDRSDVTSHSAIEIVDNVSIEYVYKRLSTDPVLDVIANKYHSTGWELFCTTSNKFALAGRNGDGTYYSMSNGAYTIQNNQYYHLVAMKEGLSWRLYVNGELYASLTANSIGTWSNTGVLQIGGEGNGYFPHMELPVFKIYNKVLSTSEIKSNFNAYKNRFNL